ncbi:hypothetical protein O3G_MSEX009050 [Manduca sexta]|uniref:Uncharacterized protein n=1 Tax=Manduca sexta TaxID=7130 RepID=A0A922CRH0_MANSE|nr:hypothetical protein O3G_MSEX009050 [Manduca sexta]
MRRALRSRRRCPPRLLLRAARAAAPRIPTPATPVSLSWILRGQRKCPH